MPVPATALDGVELRVTLKNLIFASSPREDGAAFSVWAVESADGPLSATAGIPGDAWGAPGDDVVLVGRWQDHPRYGRQLVVDSIRPYVPSGAKGMMRWLSRQPGIGPATALKVAQALGEDALSKVLENPDVIGQVPGLTAPQREAVRLAATRYQEDRARADVLVWCHRYGFGPAQADAIWREWGMRAPEILAADPWRLTGLEGFGFLTADELGRRLGVAAQDPARIRSAVLHVLSAAASEDGHVYLPRPELVGRTTDLLMDIARRSGYGGGDRTVLSGLSNAALDELAGNRRLMDDGERIYLPRLYWAEHRVREWLAGRRYAAGLAQADEARGIAFDPEIRGQLDDVQAGAVAMALAHGASVLTGGPGTGKTATTRAVLSAISRMLPSANILLAAPTGRAARRMAEVTGEPAQTLHRLLEFGPMADGEWGFRRNASAPLEGDFLIVDEASMIDLPLMAALVEAIPSGMAVLLVGDADQLPPVGPGAPFHAIVGKGLLPVTRLQHIYRQGAGSPIPVAARAVNHGTVPQEVPGDRTLRILVHPRPPRNLAGAARDQAARQLRSRMADDVLAAVRALRDRYGFMPDEIQVLVPIRRGTCGTVELNERLRAELNPDGKHQGMFVTGSGREFWLGDRVMQTANNYKKGVFNGEQGRVVAVNVPVTVETARDKVERTGFVVEFDDGAETRRVSYYSGDAHELDLAYAVTVHKAQGSEYPAVVMVVGWDSYLLLQRQLIYTGMTRAARHLILIAEDGTLARAVSTIDGAVRNQALGGAETTVADGGAGP